MAEARIKWRLIAAAVLVAAAIFRLEARLVQLHLKTPEEKLGRILSPRVMIRNLPARRGNILDRNGQTLALDIISKQMWADPSKLRAGVDIAATAEILASATGRPAELYRTKLDSDSEFVFLPAYGEYLSDEKWRMISDLKPKGISFNDVMTRLYPMNSCMCHVLGFVNLENVGSAGIEQKLDDFLRGVPGLVVGEFNARREELYDRRSLEKRPKPGANVVLTIDQYVQYLVECALDRAMETNRCEAAWAIVQKIKTGEILAMASRPAYNPNEFRNAESEARRNRCIGVIYEPGSTFKIVALSAAFNEGLITPDDTFDCENGCWRHMGRPLRDYHPYGTLKVSDIVKKSSNIGTAKIALILNQKRLYSYLREFGIGSPTGIELAGEESGMLAPLERWSKISLSRISIGHGVAVTAVQMLNAMCAIANDGLLMKPYLVDRVQDENGEILFKQRPTVVSRPISAETAKLMRKLLVGVTEQGGTGARAHVEGYEVGGKTGTAQKPVDGGYSDLLNVSSFAGFIPADDPEIGIIVVIDEPKGFRTGGAVAAPVFREIAADAVRYLDIPPVETLMVAERR